MQQFIARRILISIVVLFGVSVMLYALARLMPSDFVTLTTSTQQKITEAQREHLRELYGLNSSFLGGYFEWQKGAIMLDFGVSLAYARPVAEVIWNHMGVTFSIALLALLFELLLALPLGILAARRRNTKTDYTITAFVFIGISLPSFFFAALLKRSFGYYGLNILPVTGMLDPKVIYNGFSFAKLIDYARHLIMPITVFAITACGTWLRYTRANMIEALGSDYVRTARAKGVPERRVVYTHAFKNTLIPLVTLLGMQLPMLFSGAMITENLFGLPGIGSIALKAYELSDVPFLMGYNMFLAAVTILGYLISDILYAAVDPRIRYK
ncbi:MAG: ABC transporter permease [Oscillospiraceae bacterium]|nr:ABC transporter permease [Oscillospiraceae bacterium]